MSPIHRMDLFRDKGLPRLSIQFTLPGNAIAKITTKPGAAETRHGERAIGRPEAARTRSPQAIVRTLVPLWTGRRPPYRYGQA